jgi:iron complex transport system permease protein
MMDISKSHQAYGLYKTRRKAGIVGAVSAVMLVVFVCLFSNMGEAKIPILDVIKIIVGKVFGNANLYEGLSKGIIAIVWDIRLPRILTGMFVGAGLCVSGAVFQSLLLNPLADPFTLGISTGAAFGASISIYITGILAIAVLPILPMAFIGAVLTLFLVISIANKSKGISSGNLIISGIIVSAIMSAGISFIKNAAGDDVGAIIFWLMGSLASRTWTHVLVVFISVVVGCVICFYYANELNILCMGETSAKGLGVNVKRVRMMLLLCASLLTAACVSVSGIIGFIGLVVPHMLRFSLTSDNKVLLPLSAMLGAMMLMIADTASRTMFVSEIPVGVLTTLIGGPFFIYLFIRKSNKRRA